MLKSYLENEWSEGGTGRVGVRRGEGEPWRDRVGGERKREGGKEGERGRGGKRGWSQQEAPVSIRGNGRQSDAVTAPAINIL